MSPAANCGARRLVLVLGDDAFDLGNYHLLMLGEPAEQITLLRISGEIADQFAF